MCPAPSIDDVPRARDAGGELLLQRAAGRCASSAPVRTSVGTRDRGERRAAVRAAWPAPRAGAAGRAGRRRAAIASMRRQASSSRAVGQVRREVARDADESPNSPRSRIAAHASQLRVVAGRALAFSSASRVTRSRRLADDLQRDDRAQRVPGEREPLGRGGEHARPPCPATESSRSMRPKRSAARSASDGRDLVPQRRVAEHARAAARAARGAAPARRARARDGRPERGVDQVRGHEGGTAGARARRPRVGERARHGRRRRRARARRRRASIAASTSARRAPVARATSRGRRRRSARRRRPGRRGSRRRAATASRVLDLHDDARSRAAARRGARASDDGAVARRRGWRARSPRRPRGG